MRLMGIVHCSMVPCGGVPQSCSTSCTQPMACQYICCKPQPAPQLEAHHSYAAGAFYSSSHGAHSQACYDNPTPGGARQPLGRLRTND
jgi:hypothetical protein